jgi:hypothetical protein
MKRMEIEEKERLRKKLDSEREMGEQLVRE